MKPEIALKIDYDRFKEYTREQIETTRDEWIAASAETGYIPAIEWMKDYYFDDDACVQAEI